MSDEKSPKPHFKNKSERNAGFKSQAQIIFKDKQILNERPIEMNVDEYRVLRKIQSETLKHLFSKGHSPSRKLSGIMGRKEPLARTKKGETRVVKRMIKQRKVS